MIYFSPPTSSQQVHQAMFRGEIGFIKTYEVGNRLFDGVTWCMDNGCFSPSRAKRNEPWDEGKWWACLERHAYAADRCIFATAPDVVNFVNGEPIGDAQATLIKSAPWYTRIRSLGYPVALVAQDGLEVSDIPWREIDALFIGGSDDFKIGPAGIRKGGTPLGPIPCEPLIRAAQERGIWTHYGRVNSRMRFLLGAKYLRCNSADGTYVRFGPDKNLPKLLKWVREVEQS